MNRRGFLGSLGVVSVVAAVPMVTLPIVVSRTPIYVVRADGTALIVGVAMERVAAGDLVQIQTYGPSRVNTKGNHG